jgi:hypothetical protein
MAFSDSGLRTPSDLHSSDGAEMLEDLLARTRVPGRPADLVDDDVAFIRAASGRGQHPDPRLPILR